MSKRAPVSTGRPPPPSGPIPSPAAAGRGARAGRCSRPRTRRRAGAARGAAPHGRRPGDGAATMKPLVGAAAAAGGAGRPSSASASAAPATRSAGRGMQARAHGSRARAAPVGMVAAEERRDVRGTMLMALPRGLVRSSSSQPRRTFTGLPWRGGCVPFLPSRRTTIGSRAAGAKRWRKRGRGGRPVPAARPALALTRLRAAVRKAPAQRSLLRVRRPLPGSCTTRPAGRPGRLRPRSRRGRPAAA